LTVEQRGGVKALARQVLPSPVWRQLSSMRARLKSVIAPPARVQKYMEMAGYAVALKSDYYSPLMPVSELKATFDRWNRPSGLSGVSYDIEGMKRTLANLLAEYLPEFLAIPSYETLKRLGFGPGYTAVDALTLYLMIRHLKPRRYVEIGSGLSTYYCTLAAAQNAREGHPVTIVCVEPNPYDQLLTIPGIEIIKTEVQDVDLSVFQGLQSNDILFIDSSHILRIDGDVPFLYLEVLPRLNVGVVIQIHDVPFPYNIPYPPQLWVFGREWPQFWNEAMLVQAFLCFNSHFRILLSTPLIRHADEMFLKQRIPFYESVEENLNTFSSLWLRRES
jgi:predicted O-methyltransferase YrrM